MHNEHRGLYFDAFDDSLSKSGKKHPMIQCVVCRHKVPAQSTNAKICEMCFDDDFWDQFEHLENIAKDKNPVKFDSDIDNKK